MDTVLVTGSSSGIGRMTAEVFARNGWRVYATARNPDDVSDLAEMGMETPPLDVTDGEQIRNVVELIAEEGTVDAVVNNAGYGQMGAIEEVPTDSVESQFEVNVYGPHRVARAALPYMREQGDGTIINVSSVAGQVSLPGMGVYAGSKHALEAMTDALRAEVDGFGIDVALIEPGPVETSFLNRADDELEGTEDTGAYEDLYDSFERYSEEMTGRFGVGPEKVARTIYEAAADGSPKPRYTVTVPFRLMRLSGRLPSKLRDGFFNSMR